MKLRYTLNRADWIAYYNYCSARNAESGLGPTSYWEFLRQKLLVFAILPVVFVTVLAALVFVPMQILVWMGAPRFPEAFIVSVIFVVLAGIIASFLAPVNQRYERRKDAKRQTARMVDQAIRAGSINVGQSISLSIAPDGIIEHIDLWSNSGGVEMLQQWDYRVTWAAVAEIDEFEHRVLIRLNDERTFIIPSHAFDDEESQNHFVAVVKGMAENGRTEALGRVTAQSASASSLIRTAEPWQGLTARQK
jgi:hypothetical protein